MQEGGPPIIVAASAPASIKRTAEMGLGFNPVATDREGLASTIEASREAERQARRTPGSLPVVVRVNSTINTRPVDKRALLGGSPEQVTEDLAWLEPLDLDEVFWSMDYHPLAPEDQLDRMRSLLDAG